MSDTLTLPMLKFEELSEGMRVVIMNTSLAGVRAWIPSHTGTITRMNHHNGGITFNLPNKEADSCPTLAMDLFQFSDVRGSGAKSFFLIRAGDAADYIAAHPEPESLNRAPLGDPFDMPPRPIPST